MDALSQSGARKMLHRLCKSSEHRLDQIVSFTVQCIVPDRNSAARSHTTGRGWMKSMAMMPLSTNVEYRTMTSIRRPWIYARR